MKQLLAVLMVLGLAIPCFAITAEETKSGDNTTISITFTQDEYDLFSLDKGDPKEWIRNACEVNNSRRKERMKDKLKKDVEVSEEAILKEIEKIKAEKDKDK